MMTIGILIAFCSVLLIGPTYLEAVEMCNINTINSSTTNYSITVDPDVYAANTTFKVNVSGTPKQVDMLLLMLVGSEAEMISFRYRTENMTCNMTGYIFNKYNSISLPHETKWTSPVNISNYVKFKAYIRVNKRTYMATKKLTAASTTMAPGMSTTAGNQAASTTKAPGMNTTAARQAASTTKAPGMNTTAASQAASTTMAPGMSTTAGNQAASTTKAPGMNTTAARQAASTTMAPGMSTTAGNQAASTTKAPGMNTTAARQAASTTMAPGMSTTAASQAASTTMAPGMSTTAGNQAATTTTMAQTTATATSIHSILGFTTGIPLAILLAVAQLF
ncbi:mucin-5AC-like [Latimeria chalumnae]|uniref:mucin-5AC-like n=1 Tax=Latimeria chalumnae TaxID=7897 RepID=UPI00313B3811